MTLHTEGRTEGRVRHLPACGPVDAAGREVLLELKNVDITFGRGERAVRAVRDVSFRIYRGETFSLVGESGSGKTTVGRAVIRVNPVSAGEILYRGVRISGRIPRALDREVIRNIQMVFQDPAASLNERATVDYIVSEGLYNFHLYENEADRVRRVEEIIREVGLLPEHLTRYPHEFSGGQRQRIGLARAMVMEPELVVADEPISALDVSVRAQVLNLMKKFQRERRTTYLFIAHDLSIVRFISDRIGVIYKGRIVEVAPAEELFEYPLHPYTRSLISAIPIPDPQLERQKKLLVYDPSVHGEPVGMQTLTDIGHDHFVFGDEREVDAYRRIRAEGIRTRHVGGARQGAAVTAPDAVGAENFAVEAERPAMERERPREDLPEGDLPENTTPGSPALSEGSADAAAEAIIEAPPHDTGHIGYSVGAFFLPVVGLAAGGIFKKHRHIRNYLACRRGGIAGLVVRGAAVGLFALALVLAVL